MNVHRRLAAVGLAVAICFALPLSAADTTYEYDARGRLISVKQGTTKEANYVYDDAGNRVQANTGHPPGNPGAPVYETASIWASNAVSWAAAPKNKADSAVYRLQKSFYGGAWTNVGDVTSATSMDVILEVDGVYQFRVKACNEEHPLACSNYVESQIELELRLQPDPPIMTTPTGDTTVTLNGGVVFAWASGSGGGAVHAYRMQRGTPPNDWPHAEELGDATSKMIIFDGEHGYDHGVYWFRIVACNVFWSCNPGDALKVTVAPPTPGTPSVSADDNHDGVFDVSWNSSLGASSYKLYERINGNWSSTPVTISGTSTNLTRNDGSYAYRVRACAGGACSPYSDTSAEIAIANKPGVPGNISNPSQSTSGEFTVSWGAASASGAASVKYLLQQSKNNGSWSTVGSWTTGTSRSIDVGNGDYKYRVKACNGSNTSICSDYRASSTTEVRFKPSVPQNLDSPFSVPAGSNSNFNVTWDASSGTVTHYNLQQTTGGGYSTIYTGLSRSRWIPAGTTVYVFHTFRVRACNDWACSSYSSTTTTRTTTGGYCGPNGCSGPDSVDPDEPVMMEEPGADDGGAMTISAVPPQRPANFHQELNGDRASDRTEAA